MIIVLYERSRDIIGEKMKRLNIEIPEELHKKIKVKSAQRNITVRLWVSRLLLKALKQEEIYEKETEKDSNDSAQTSSQHGKED